MTQKILTLDEIARLFCVTEKAVRGWIASGLPIVSKGTRGGARKKTTIALEAAVVWYFRENFERLELDRARTGLASEQARALALANSERTRELGEWRIWVEEVDRFFEFTRLLALALPASVAPLLDGDVNRRKDALERAFHELLTTLASYPADRN